MNKIFASTALVFLSILTSASAVVTIGHNQNVGLGNGTFRTSSGAIPSSGGVSIGFFSGAVPSDATLKNLNPSTAYADLIALGYVDVRNVAASADGTAGGLDYPGIGATISNLSTSGAYSLNKQLFVLGFNAGAYIAGTEGNMASTNASFAGSSEWAIVTNPTLWKHTADPSGITILLNDVSGTSQVIVGTEGGLGDGTHDIRLVAVPEPSRAILCFGAFTWIGFRRRR